MNSATKPAALADNAFRPSPSRPAPRLAVLLVVLLVGCESADKAWFTEQATERGIAFEHHSGYRSRHMLPEIMGGGVALADIDGDKDLDLYLVQSGRVDGTLPESKSANHLYVNDGHGRFSRIAGGDAGDRRYGMGVASGDYDNDGDVDLYVTNLGRNTLLQNDGTGTFRDVTEAAGVGDTGWGTAATFLDLDLDGDLDLFLVNYLHWSPDIEQDCYAIAFFTTYCGPTVYGVPAMDRLYRNNGDGTFSDVTLEAGVDAAFGNGLGSVGADFNNDGLIDIFVANDTMVNQLWINQGDLRFSEECLLWSCALDENGIAKAGMGVASADVDDDGDNDLLIVNLERQSDSYFRNEGKYFIDATSMIGLRPTSMRHTRFGVVLADFDNDTRLDLYEANGKVQLSGPSKSDGFAEPNTLYQGSRRDGTVRFDEIKPQGGVSRPLVHTSRGVAVGDINEDGGVDLVVVNRDAPPYLLINNARRGNWVRFEVLTREGRNAIGATVSIRIGDVRINRDVQPSASYLASSDPRVHFGLGEHPTANQVTVHWPTGEREAFGDFAGGKNHRLIQGGGTVATTLRSTSSP